MTDNDATDHNEDGWHHLRKKSASESRCCKDAASKWDKTKSYEPLKDILQIMIIIIKIIIKINWNDAVNDIHWFN